MKKFLTFLLLNLSLTSCIDWFIENEENRIDFCKKQEKTIFNQVKKQEEIYKNNKDYKNLVNYKNSLNDYINLECTNNRTKEEFKNILESLK